MGRVINLKATQEHVQKTCAKHNMRITAIESLLSGGTRVVMSNAGDAASITKAYGSKVIDGRVERTPLKPARF
jgi:hypothetical protein